LKDPETANLGHHLQRVCCCIKPSSLLLHPSEHAEPAISSDSGRKKERKKERKRNVNLPG
jgi:hypothetical protein